MNHKRRHKILLALLIVSVCIFQSVGQPRQEQEKQSPILSIGGEVQRPLKVTPADLARLPRKTVTAKDHDGKETTFDGVELREVLNLAGVQFGESLRGKNLALYLLVEAADGYRAVFALPELDNAFSQRVVLLADKRDGKQLSATEGPWRLVVPDEKRQARWVRQVTALNIRRAE